MLKLRLPFYFITNLLIFSNVETSSSILLYYQSINIFQLLQFEQYIPLKQNKFSFPYFSLGLM